jgi:hypothetical protein
VVVRVGDAILPAGVAYELERRRMHAIALGVVEFAEVFQEAGRGELAHPVAREPEYDVGRRARQPVTDGLLVVFSWSYTLLFDLISGFSRLEAL